MHWNAEATIQEWERIYKEFKFIIDSDSVLKRDFNALRKELFPDSDDFEVYRKLADGCESILQHLLSEIDESIWDEERLDDESPAAESDKDAERQYQYSRLKQAVERFDREYITVSSGGRQSSKKGANV
tara:strand:+ start:648 stop:1034 length:387 start_codon:yes stop_codon:yes gene_type:complete